MEDDLDKLGVAPSDRKKLESMGITKLEQLALLSHEQLGMGRGKGQTLIRRTRNIIAHEHIEDIEITDEVIRIFVNDVSRAIIKSILSVLNVYDVPPGSVTLQEKDGVIELWKRTKAFERVYEAAIIEKEILNGRANFDNYTLMSEEQILQFAQERGFEGFWKNAFEEIRGNDIIKKSLTVSMFSTFQEPVHTLVIGEPGSSKTLAKEIIEQNFRNITTIGANTTRAGLVINLATGDLGALTYSHERVVLVDELDKIPGEDIEYCYELLSNGKCSVHSAKIHEEIHSQFIMIAFANPSSQVFGTYPLDEISLPPLLMSRFALIVKTEKIDKDTRFNLFMQKFYGKGEIKDKPSFYAQWVEMAKAHCPVITADKKRIKQYLSTINEIVEETYATQLRRDLRMGDYIRRVPQAIARAGYDSISNEVLDVAENIFVESISTWHQN